MIAAAAEESLPTILKGVAVEALSCLTCIAQSLIDVGDAARVSEREVSRRGGSLLYFTDDSLLPENQNSLIISGPLGPVLASKRHPKDIAVSWNDQVQKALDCFNAGASILHVHVRDSKTGKLSKKMSDFDYIIEHLRKAVPRWCCNRGGASPVALVPLETAETLGLRWFGMVFGWLGFALTLGLFGASAGRWMTDLPAATLQDSNCAD